MIEYHLKHGFHFAVFVSSLWVLMMIYPQQATVQTCPSVPALSPFNPQVKCWPFQGQIKVTINSDPNNQGFTSLQIAAIWQAFENWNQHRGFADNCSEVFFSQSSGEYQFDVIKTDIPDGDADLGGNDNGAFRTDALMRIDPDYLPTDAFVNELTRIAAHEIGHSFGMGDCPTCPCQTVMT